MTDVLETSDDGTLRVVLMRDEDAGKPEADECGYVFNVDRTRWSAEWVETLNSNRPGDPFADDIADGIARCMHKWGNDWDRMERYLRIVWDAVAVDWWDRRSGGRFLAVVTSSMADAWNVPASSRTPEILTKGTLVEYAAWDEGDVWSWEIQRRVRWMREDGDDTMETWEPEDSCGGYYGRDYAEEQAREALAGFRQ